MQLVFFIAFILYVHLYAFCVFVFSFSLISASLTNKGIHIHIVSQRNSTPHLQKSLRLRRFKLDRDEIWQDCSSSKYASSAESDFRFDVNFQDGGHDVIPCRKCCHLASQQKHLLRICVAAYDSSWFIVHLYWLIHKERRKMFLMYLMLCMIFIIINYNIICTGTVTSMSSPSSKRMV